MARRSFSACAFLSSASSATFLAFAVRRTEAASLEWIIISSSSVLNTPQRWLRYIVTHIFSSSSSQCEFMCNSFLPELTISV